MLANMSKKICSSFNNPYAKNNLALIYKNGDGVEKNIANVIEYLNEAIKIDKNNKAALINLSRIYFYGDGCDADINRAIYLLFRACEKDIAYSPMFLCFMLLTKLGSSSFSFDNIKERS